MHRLRQVLHRPGGLLHRGEPRGARTHPALSRHLAPLAHETLRLQIRRGQRKPAHGTRWALRLSGPGPPLPDLSCAPETMPHLSVLAGACRPPCVAARGAPVRGNRARAGRAGGDPRAATGTPAVGAPKSLSRSRAATLRCFISRRISLRGFSNSIRWVIGTTTSPARAPRNVSPLSRRSESRGPAAPDPPLPRRHTRE